VGVRLLVRTALQALVADAGTSGHAAGAPAAAHPGRPRRGERR
jgi:amidohydrolase